MTNPTGGTTHPVGGGGTHPVGGSGTGPGRALEVFSFPATGQEIRTVVSDDGEPCVVLADVCAVLALSNPRMVAARLDDDEVSQAYVTDSMGRQQLAHVVTEAGLYAVILRSEKPEAKAFKRWITHEVLPSIRSTGRYEVANEVANLDEIEVARRWLAALEGKKAAEIRADQAEQRLAVAAPKATYVDTFVQPDDVTTIRVFAGQLGVGENALRGYLVARGVLYRRLVGHYWSRSKQKNVPEYEWLAHSKYAPWFVAKDQPQAPRMHNGQLRTTLYVTPRGKAGIKAMVAKRPIVGQDDLDMGEAS